MKHVRFQKAVDCKATETKSFPIFPSLDAIKPEDCNLEYCGLVIEKHKNTNGYQATCSDKKSVKHDLKWIEEEEQQQQYKMVKKD